MSNFSNFSNQYRYILEKGSKKHHCPECNKKCFVRYVDIKTGEYLPEQYGRCDRESKCAYILNPYKDGYSKMIWEQEQKVTGVTKLTVLKQKYLRIQPKPHPTPQPIFFDFNTFKQTLSNYEKNNFIQNLLQNISFPFMVTDIKKIISIYRLGTISKGYRKGANTFPFIDINNNVRTIQVKQFDKNNHTTGTDFLHSIIEKHHTRNNKLLPEWLEAYQKNEIKVSCLFGEHLLNKYPHNPIALVEAPKTAIYGTLYFGFPGQPKDLIWLAVYNKSSFSFDKLKILKGRFVYVFPDLSKDGKTFKEWETKAKDYEDRLPKTKFIFSNLLEQLAPQQDKEQGKDIADYLIKQDWRLFRKQDIKEPPQPELEKVTKVTKVTPKKNIYFSNVKTLPKTKVLEPQPENWSKDITEIEDYFLNIKIPQQIRLNKYSNINDVQKFIDNHLATVKANNGNKTFLPYLNRLKQIINFI